MVSLLIALSIGYALTTRIILMASFGLPEASSLPTVFATGLLYDFAFSCYIVLPLAGWLLLPHKIRGSFLGSALLHAFVFSYVFVLGFIAEAEFLFFAEFGARFNFIAVDYLVYTTEVLVNIVESYPLAWLLAADLVVSIGIYRLLRPLVDRCVETSGPRGGSRVAAGMLVTAALIPAVLLDQVPRDAIDRSMDRELASNGPYQLFASFRHNELDYHQFYPTRDLAVVDSVLRREVREPGARFLGHQPLGNF